MNKDDEIKKLKAVNAAYLEMIEDLQAAAQEAQSMCEKLIDSNKEIMEVAKYQCDFATASTVYAMARKKGISAATSRELDRVLMAIEYWRKPETGDLIAVIENGEVVPEVVLDYIRLVHERAEHVRPIGKRKLSEHDIKSQQTSARLMVLNEFFKAIALSGEKISKAEAIRRVAGKPILLPGSKNPDGWSERKLKGLLKGYKPPSAK